MAVHCGGCGEELLGSVNRCWRCGRPLVAQSGSGEAPPVVRPPIPRELVALRWDSTGEGRPVIGDRLARSTEGKAGEEGPVLADLLEPLPVGVSQAVGVSQEGHGVSQEAGGPRQGGVSQSDEKPDRPTRRGSPFADPEAGAGRPHPLHGSLEHPLAPRQSAPARSTASSGNGAAVGGAVASLVLALMTLAACWFTHAAILTGLLGLAMGIWGLYSSRRAMAVAGVVLSLLALSISGFWGAVDWYTYVYKTNPFEDAAPPEVNGPDDGGLPSEL